MAVHAPLRRLGSEVGKVVRADTASHLHLRERLTTVFAASLVLDLIAAVAIYFLERGKTQTGIHTFGDALFWTSAQLLTVSSQMPNPVTTGGKIIDLFLELWAITAVTAVAGSFGAFFHRRGMERDPLALER
jgi:pseudouridine-5'-phosphate glycosidase